MDQKNVRMDICEWEDVLDALGRRIFDLQYVARSYELYGDYENFEEAGSLSEAREMVALYFALTRKIRRQLRMNES